ncbi:Histone-lysine N-methyltransferase PR-Set7 [Polyplax serrata]|uniref:[histone H4]-lysine(20) N-methyltransferase n=1 Tax=Polyplax serrata TaxID=468196 RepID=A0AAN8S7K7_POLSC
MNSKKKKSGCILAERKKKNKNNNGGTLSPGMGTKPLQAWLERVSSPVTNKYNQANCLSVKPSSNELTEKKENKNLIKTICSTDQITKNIVNKDKSQLRNCNTLSEKFPKNNVHRNHKVTEYFPVRRSVRKTKKTVLEEKQKNLEECVLSQREEGLKVVNFEGKGRGVVTTRKFYKGEFVVEYSGELIDMLEAKTRENNYAEDQNTGCYMYYFKYKSNKYCVDATAETGKLGRLVNHSRNGNLTTKIISINSIPHLVLIAKEDIEFGEEVCYDYGDRSKESLKYHPWLAS